MSSYWERRLAVGVLGVESAYEEKLVIEEMLRVRWLMNGGDILNFSAFYSLCARNEMT